MQNPVQPTFDDPAFKAAMRRNFAAERAPATLHARVLRALRDYETETTVSSLAIPIGIASSVPANTPPSRLTIAPSSWSGLPAFAMAVVFVIAVGSVAFFLTGTAQSLPQSFEIAAVQRHDLCCGALNHHGDAVPNVGFARIGAYLRQELAHPVLAANMEADGWSFRGAAICPIGNTDSAHLLFARDDRTLSVFSLPASVLPSLSENQTYEGTFRGHSIVARRADGALYCLVGQGPQGNLTVQDLDAMLRKHEPEATVAETIGPRISVAGIEREK